MGDSEKLIDLGKAVEDLQEEIYDAETLGARIYENPEAFKMEIFLRIDFYYMLIGSRDSAWRIADAEKKTVEGYPFFCYFKNDEHESPLFRVALSTNHDLLRRIRSAE